MSIEKAYNSWAEQYDNNKNRTRDMDQKVTIEILSNYRFETVLELGCGTGKNTQWLLTQVNQIIGLDFSEEMLNIAQEKVTSKKVEFKKADITNQWPVKNQYFDLITSSLMLEHIKELDPIFEQARNKIKDKGLFFICELHPFKQYVGSKARFKTETGKTELEVYIHNITEFTGSAINNGFKLLEIKEWFDEDTEYKIPRLVSFVFQKL